MKYLLFVNFNSGLKHNREYNTLYEIFESVRQLIQDEDVDILKEDILSTVDIKKYLDNNDDYFKQLSNGTWYHIQPSSILN